MECNSVVSSQSNLQEPGGSISQLQETFQDAEYAVEVLQMIQSTIPEHEIEYSTVEVNAYSLRNCMELLLSLLEVHEGVNVPAIEGMREVMQCLKVKSTTDSLPPLHKYKQSFIH